MRGSHCSRDLQIISFIFDLDRESAINKYAVQMRACALAVGDMGHNAILRRVHVQTVRPQVPSRGRIGADHASLLREVVLVEGLEFDCRGQFSMICFDQAEGERRGLYDAQSQSCRPRGWSCR